MNDFGVKERSIIQTITDAIKEVEKQKLTGCAYPCHNSGCLAFSEFEPVCGYYDLGEGDGRFFLINVFANFAPNKYVTYSVTLYAVLTNTETPAGLEVSSDASVSFLKDEFNWPEEEIYVRFSPGIPGKGKLNISGSIKTVSISGSTGGCAVPFSQFGGTYVGKGGTVTIHISDTDSSITDYKGFKTEEFTYVPLKRQFYYEENGILSQLYMNVSADYGLMLTFVRTGLGSGSTRYFYLKRIHNQGPKGPVIGAAELAAFAGFYKLDTPGAFVSIVGKTTTTAVGICTDGVHSTTHTSFIFEGNRLSFNGMDVSLDFSRTTEDSETATVTLVSSNIAIAGSNYFSVVPLAAFGKRIFSGTSKSSRDECTLQISEQGTYITYTVGGVKVIDTSAFEYNPVGQMVEYLTRRLFFTSNGLGGATCAVTLNPSGLEAVLHVYQVAD